MSNPTYTYTLYGARAGATRNVEPPTRHPAVSLAERSRRRRCANRRRRAAAASSSSPTHTRPHWRRAPSRAAATAGPLPPPGRPPCGAKYLSPCTRRRSSATSGRTTRGRRRGRGRRCPCSGLGTGVMSIADQRVELLGDGQALLGGGDILSMRSALRQRLRKEARAVDHQLDQERRVAAEQHALGGEGGGELRAEELARRDRREHRAALGVVERRRQCADSRCTIHRSRGDVLRGVVDGGGERLGAHRRLVVDEDVPAGARGGAAAVGALEVADGAGGPPRVQKSAAASGRLAPCIRYRRRRPRPRRSSRCRASGSGGARPRSEKRSDATGAGSSGVGHRPEPPPAPAAAARRAARRSRGARGA